SGLMMDRVITNNVWRQAAQFIGKQEKKIAAIAYVSKGTPLLFGKGDILICDASDQAIKSGETDAKILEDFLRRGATLYCCPNLHAKLLVSGDWAIIGSASLSASSQNVLVEASLITTRPQIRSQVRAFIHGLQRISIPIDEQFISHICSLPVSKRSGPVPVRRKKDSAELGNRYWIVSTRLLHSFPEYEEEFIERGEQEARNMLDEDSDIAWIRWIGKSKFRELAKPGDTLIEIMRHKVKREVFKPRPILVRQDHEKWARFYLEERSDSKGMSWTEFERRLRKAGLESVKKNSTRELSLREIALMESVWQM
ncbi:MAG: hypothetical protein AB1631_11420, partial [Acidobacteriota bacterium]